MAKFKHNSREAWLQDFISRAAEVFDNASDGVAEASRIADTRIRVSIGFPGGASAPRPSANAGTARCPRTRPARFS